MQLRWKTTQGTETCTLMPQPDQTVAKTVWMSGMVPAPALCSGLGRCGACRVRFVSDPPAPVPVELEILSTDELMRGVRLACRHVAAGDMDIELEGLLPSGSSAGGQSSALRGAVRLAVDLGTTSIHWKAFDDAGAVLCGKELNPQLGAGSEVMSRVGEALQPGGVQRLAGLVTDRLAAFCTEASGNGAQVVELCVAGNTAMTAIMLELDCSGLAAAPYTRPEVGGRTVSLPSRPNLPPVWIPPQPAPFVGGDVSAGLLAVLERQPRFPLLLADMGTNGEFAFMPDAETLWLTSVPLGPSLEGIGLSRGALAGPGTVTGFSLGPAGLVPRVLVSEPGSEAHGDSTAVSGISGTGYLSLLHILRAQGVLDPSGIPVTEPSRLNPMARRLAGTLIRQKSGPWHLPLPLGLSIMATDVEELIKVRAAFSLAVAHLFKAADMRPEDLAAIYLAGALGEHVAPEALEGLGFLPVGLGRRLICAGNTSLAGAELLLRKPERREPLMRLCESARVLELAGRSNFMPEYMDRMRLTPFQF